MNFVCKRFGSVKLFTYICKRILKNKFRKLNLHDRMTECHEVCDDSAFMPTKEFLQKRLCRQRSSPTNR